MLSAWSQLLEEHAQEHDKRFGPRNRQKTCKSQHKKAFGSEAGA